MSAKKLVDKPISREFLEECFSELLKAVIHGVIGTGLDESCRVTVTETDISFGSAIVNRYSEAEKRVRRNSFADEAHSASDINSACSKALYETARLAGTATTGALVKSVLDELYLALRGNPQPYEILLPLSGVIAPKKIQFHNVIFGPPTIESLHEHPKIKTLIEGRSRRVGVEIQNKDTLHFLKLGERGESKSLATIFVTAANSWAAVEKAKRELALSLGLLSLALHRMDRRRYLVPLDFANGGYADWSAAAIIDTEAKFSYMHFQSGSYAAKIDAPLRDYVIEHGMEMLFQSDDQLSEIEQSLRIGAYWVWRSLLAPFRQDAVLHGVMAIECMLKRPGIRSSSTLVLAERLARLLGTTPEEQISLEREVRHLYELRSQIVHEGHLNSPIVDIESARNMGVSTFFTALEMTAKFKLKKWSDFDSHFDRLKYGASVI